jgi:hypothetical protein
MPGAGVARWTIGRERHQHTESEEPGGQPARVTDSEPRGTPGDQHAVRDQERQRCARLGGAQRQWCRRRDGTKHLPGGRSSGDTGERDYLRADLQILTLKSKCRRTDDGHEGRTHGYELERHGQRH